MNEYEKYEAEKNARKVESNFRIEDCVQAKDAYDEYLRYMSMELVPAYA